MSALAGKLWKSFKHQSQSETSFVEGEDEVMKRVLNNGNSKLKKYQLMHPEMIKQLENAIENQVYYRTARHVINMLTSWSRLERK
eukprot:763303-Hanusia_phi.AAC.8